MSERWMPEIGGPPGEEPVFNEEGVDLTLIRWMLGLSPEERLAVAQGFVDSVAELLGGDEATG